jgi:hypothetical protein
MVMKNSKIRIARAGMLGVVWLAATGQGCATEQEEGDYIAPAGFTEQQTQQVVMHGFNFLRDENNVLRTSTSLGRQLRARAQQRDAEETQDDPALRGKLEAVFHGTYADGMTVSVATHPRASLRVVPVGAQRVSPRLRKDGALVSFEEAFPNVTSAFGGRDSKIEEFLLIPTERDVPTLSYDLQPGPDFDHFEEEEGRLWAYARDGAGLFTLEPPVADDAAGKRVLGSWKLEDTQTGFRITAQINLQGLAYPVLLDPTFETPLWFRNTSGQPSSRAGAAGAFDLSTGCSLVFGGAITASFTLAQDLAVRCGNRQWKSGMTAGTMPPKRSYGAMAYHGGATNRVFLYGGYGETTSLGDLWRADLTCSTPGVSSSCNISWTQIPVPPSGPGRRFLHGMAWTGSKILVFGGIKNTGEGLRDTWEYDADTNTWTQVCATCFGGAKGLYGFASTTLVDGGTRSIYVSGGYDDPLSNSGNFLNNVYHWTGTTWADVSAQAAQLPLNPNGAVLSGQPTAMAPRYLHWMTQTSSKTLMMGSGVFNDNVSDTYFEDTWIWKDRSSESLPNQWIRGVVPLGSSSTNFPWRRESATAIYDETLKETVLFGGLTRGTAVSNNARVYRSFERNYIFTQTCVTTGCVQVRLETTFPGLDETTSPKCSDMQASFGRQRTVDNTWGLIDGFNSATFDGSSCKRTIVTARIPSTYKDYVVRTRDRRYHEAAIECSNSSTDQEITGTAKPVCLSNGGEGYSACGGLATPTNLSIPCEIF